MFKNQYVADFYEIYKLFYFFLQIVCNNSERGTGRSSLTYGRRLPSLKFVTYFSYIGLSSSAFASLMTILNSYFDI